MFRNWIPRSTVDPATNFRSESDKQTDLDNLEDALNGISLVFNDDVEGAERILSSKSGSFHKLGHGLILFLKASLGLEAGALQLAANSLAEAETSSANDVRRAQRSGSTSLSDIYASGTEFTLCIAVAQLTSAMVAVLRESLVEGMKGFLKLNSAYKTLQKILEAESAYIKQRSSSVPENASPLPARSGVRQTSTSSSRASAFELAKQLEDTRIAQSPTNQHEQENDEDEFYDAEEGSDTLLQDKPHVSGTTTGMSSGALLRTQSSLSFDHEFLAATDLKNSSDVFIHSSTSLCLGVLLVLLSLIPPTFSRVLGLVGYKGDRSRGLQMLWSSSKYSSPVGAFSGFLLLVYYNVLMGSRDLILPVDPTKSIWSSANIDAYPAAQLEELLETMQTRFPNSKIWPIERARMLALHRNLDASLEILTGNIDTPLKQLQAMAIFERSLEAMYSHRFELCTSSFKECCKWNDWSHSLYLYCAGIAQLELYRIAVTAGQEGPAKGYAASATKLFREAVTKIGRRKAFGRQLPFDVFIAHRVSKWESRAAAHRIALIDAIGVSPLEEMTYLWNGFRKMPPDCLETSLIRITWLPPDSVGFNSSDGDLGEKALSVLLRAVVLRSLGRYDEAMELLKSQVLSLDKHEFKGSGSEGWVLPAAHYELGINLWLACHREDPLTTQGTQSSLGYLISNPIAEGERGETNKQLVLESLQFLEKAAKWDGTYMLDTRLGMRFSAALDTVRRWKTQWMS